MLARNLYPQSGSKLRLSPTRFPSLKQIEALRKLLPQQQAPTQRGSHEASWSIQGPQLTGPQLLAVTGLSLQALRARIQKIRDIREGRRDCWDAWWQDSAEEDALYF